MKDFRNWMTLKEKIDNDTRKFFVKSREVVWLHLGENVGDEENGKGELFQRPVLILKIYNKNIFLGVPLSTKIKPNNKYYRTLRITS